MKRKFNTTGSCNPQRHYMVKLNDRLKEIKENLVDCGDYFVINRGRQYGKTTTLGALEQYLKDDYIVLSLDFQEFSTGDFEDDIIFSQTLVKKLVTAFRYVEAEDQLRDMLLDFYFEVRHFLLIYDLLDENYVKYTQTGEDGSFRVKLFCVNPRENLKNCMLRGRSAILFSATFLPIQYYKKLLGGDPEDFEVYAHSVFDPARRALLIAEDVTSKYTRRSEEEYDRIAWYIEEIVKNRHGNYMVFCPSHAFMNRVYEKYVDNFAGAERQCIIQGESMSEADREAFLQYFRRTGAEESTGQPPGQRENPMDAEKPDITGQKGNQAGTEDMDFPGKGSIREQGDQERDRMLVGFCVLGGIFSEGIDLKGDSLIGVIIVGTGLPQVSDERGILKAYFDENGEDGFAYAFRYPGMNKVLQAAGRVIRTVEDVGIIALLDERFLQFSYRRLFPREWENFETVSVNRVAKRVERFWDEWL